LNCDGRRRKGHAVPAAYGCVKSSRMGAIPFCNRTSVSTKKSRLASKSNEQKLAEVRESSDISTLFSFLEKKRLKKLVPTLLLYLCRARGMKLTRVEETFMIFRICSYPKRPVFFRANKTTFLLKGTVLCRDTTVLVYGGLHRVSLCFVHYVQCECEPTATRVVNVITTPCNYA
jgi:hypothetical protein